MDKQLYNVNNPKSMPSMSIDNNGYFVSVEWLSNQIMTDADLIVAYVDRHDIASAQLIPNSIIIDSSDFGPYNGLFFDAEECRKALSKYGISIESHVVLYSLYTRVASRIAFVLYWLGFKNFKILNGGVNAWSEASYSTVLEARTPIPIESPNFISPEHPEALISTSEDLRGEIKNNPNLVLASVRNWDEYTGKTIGHSWNEARGEIYGAVFAGYHNIIDNRELIVSPDIFLEEWKNWGITPDKTIVFYCGTGWRASLAFFIAKELNWSDVKLFDGSWFIWKLAHNKNPERFPIQLGRPYQYPLIIKEKVNE